MGETHDAQRTTPRTATPSDGGPRAKSGGEAAAPGPPEPERRADNRRGGAKPGAAQHDRGRPAHRESRDRDRPARAAPADARRAARPGRREDAQGEGQRQGKRRRARPDHHGGPRPAGAQRGRAAARSGPSANAGPTTGGGPAFASPAGDKREGRSAARRRGTARRPPGRRSTLACLPLWRQTTGRRGPTEEARGRRPGDCRWQSLTPRRSARRSRKAAISGAATLT